MGVAITSDTKAILHMPHSHLLLNTEVWYDDAKFDVSPDALKPGCLFDIQDQYAVSPCIFTCTALANVVTNTNDFSAFSMS